MNSFKASALPARAGNPGPLSGLRVLDLSAYIAGPYGCALLADQGAEVIKIEPPIGDNLRKYPSTLETESRAFLGVNRSKLGVVLDLKKPEDLDTLLALVRTADVLVHNFRPSVAPRLGISYEQIQSINPRLIYCAVSGYGETGPLSEKAGYDQVLQSMTGICTLQGKADGPPEIVYGSVVDYYAAALVAAGVSSALYERERSGVGQHVGISLLRSAMAMQSARLVWADDETRDVGRDMRSGGITGLHPTREGHLYISANTPHFWRALCDKIGLPELAQDTRYDSVRKRAQQQNDILPQLHKALAARSALEWETVFGEEVPCAAARSVEDMFDDPQVLAHYRGFTTPVEFSRTPGPTPFAAPTLGQHSDAIRTEAQRQKKYAPEGACDSHIHIYDARFAPQAGKQLLSGCTAQDYQREIQKVLGTQRTVVVTPTVYGTDNRVTLDAIEQLGITHARGVAVLHPDVSDAELQALHAGGIRGIRFTLFDPVTSVTSFDMIEPLAKRVHALGWHVQLHLRAEQIVANAALIESLPCKLVFDHMARLPTQDGGLNQAAFDIVKQRLDRRNTWVKLSGAYLDARGPQYEGSFTAARALVKAAPDRMVWGSDWPHPTEKQQRPDDGALFALLAQWVPDAALRQQILVANAVALYGF